MADYLLNYLNTNPYLILFLGSLLDHSGIPIFSIVAAILYSSHKIDLLKTFCLVILSYTLVDILLFILGKKYYMNKLKSKELIKTIDVVLIEKGLKVYLKNRNSFYFFSKLIPIFGKYSSIFAGVSNENFFKIILKYLIGNVLYFMIFFIPSMFIGEKIKNNSKWITLLMFLIFIVIYKIGENRLKKSSFYKEK